MMMMKNMKQRRVRFATPAVVASNNDAAERREQNHEEQEQDHEQQQQHEDEKKHTANNALELTPKLCRQLWYQHDEIATMKNDVREIVYLGQTKATKDSEKSGLHRYCTDRVRHKKEVIQYILKAYRKISYSKMNIKSGVELLSKTSQISTKWSSNVARYHAYKDYQSVYGGCDTNNNDNDNCENRTDVAMKRKQSTEVPVAGGVCGSSRNVRQRTISDNSKKMLQRV